jgi:SAM-dependent methyltransferase
MLALVHLLQRTGWLHSVLGLLRRAGLIKTAFRLYERVVALTVTPGSEQTSRLRYPLPPAHLRVLVAGTAETRWFLQFGHAMFDALQTMLARHHIILGSMDDVLEFGCGCGRVLRHWAPDRSIASPRLHGCDYNPRLVEWCRTHLPFATIQQNAASPPLPFDSERFSLVYAVSVFTHMSSDLQQQWMNELHRVIRRHGCLVITTQGDSFVSRLDVVERRRFASGEMVARFEEASGSNLCSIYHPKAYVRSELAAGFDVVDFLPAGTFPDVGQDAYLLRKR